MSLYKNFTQEKRVGEYTIYLPDPPNLKDIANKDLPQQKQKFYRTPLPKDFYQWDEKSKFEFESAEWKKRTHGYWFWNNGNLEWMAPAHYFFCNWWAVDGGIYPIFTDAQRDTFQWWELKVKRNSLARGGIFITNRRFGKTHVANCIGYHTVSTLPEQQHMGIQSKSFTDAKKVFDKLIISWKKLPDFFKPIDTGDTNPQKKLMFFEPGKRDTKNQKKEYGQALNSFIDYENSKEIAYDGSRLEFCIQDEVGKDEENNVYERIQVVKECVYDGGIIGKIFATTTVEEMEKKGGANCKKVWDSADPDGELMPNGETQMGLLRYFSPAYYGDRGVDEKGVPFVNEYGYTDIERAKNYYLRKRDAIRDRDLLTSERRKYPLDIRDCFISDSRKSTYDLGKIEDQLDYNSKMPDGAWVYGDFIWRDGKQDTFVDFHHDRNGRWRVMWMPPHADRNKIILRGSKKAPGNTDMGVFGLDPYDNKLTSDGRKSDAAAYGFRRYNPLNDKETGIFVVEYVNRPKNPEIMWEDMIKMCVFYGWEILIESQKQGTINHFRMRGYEKYLMHATDNPEIPGIPMTTDTQQTIIYLTENYIVKKVGWIEVEGGQPFMGRCYFDKLLKCWMDFNFEDKWTKYDSMVGAGLALLAANFQMTKKKKVSQSLSMIPQYKNIGARSKLVTPDKKR